MPVNVVAVITGRDHGNIRLYRLEERHGKVLAPMVRCLVDVGFERVGLSGARRIGIEEVVHRAGIEVSCQQDSLIPVSHAEDDGVSIDRLPGVAIPGVRRSIALERSAGPQHFDNQGVLGCVIRRQEPVGGIEALTDKAALGEIDPTTKRFHFFDDNGEVLLGLIHRADQLLHKRREGRTLRLVRPVNEAIQTVVLVRAGVLLCIRSPEKAIVVKALHGDLRICQDGKESLGVVVVTVRRNDGVEIDVIVWLVKPVFVADEMVSVVRLPGVNQDTSVLRSLDENPVTLTDIDKEDFEMAISC